MAYEQKPGEFVLFKNDKGDNPKRPDYRGEGMDLNGQSIEVAAWIKEGKKGKFMSCTIKLKDGQAYVRKGSDQPKGFSNDDSDIPF